MRERRALLVVLLILFISATAPLTNAVAPGLTAEIHMPASMNVTAHNVDWTVAIQGTVSVDKPPGVTVDVTLTATNNMCWMVQCFPTEMTFAQPGNQSFSITVGILAGTTDASCTVTVEMHAQGAGLPVVATASCLVSVRGAVQKEPPAQSMPAIGVRVGEFLGDPVFMILATAITGLTVAATSYTIWWRRKRARRAKPPPAQSSGTINGGQDPS